MASCVTFEYIRKNPDIRTYIQRADAALKSIGYTEHSFPHVEKAAATAARILTELGYPEREIELARIAGFLHDIGNVINRVDHAQSGAVMAFRLLDRLEMSVGKRFLSEVSEFQQVSFVELYQVAESFYISSLQTVEGTN